MAGIALIAMIVILMQDEPPEDRYQRQVTKEMSSIFNLFAHNNHLGPRIKDASKFMEEYARRYVDLGPKDGHDVVVHPLYASLQDQSPLGLN